MGTRRIEALGGDHILDVLEGALLEVRETGDVVTFDFNGTEHEVRPGDDLDAARARASERAGLPILTREEAAERARKERGETEARWAKAIANAGAMTEMQMREADVPWPKSEEELVEYVRSLVDRPHDYGTCVYAMSMAATAAFYYVSNRLGVTGFQASCADMDILRRTRHLKHGFRIVDYGDLLYPQYWDDELRPIFLAALKENGERYAEAARALLERSNGGAHPNVRAHWEMLASAATPPPEAP